MPVDWTELNGTIDKAIEDAITETDDELASKVSSLIRLTDAEIKELFPTASDLKNLAELMEIVKSHEQKHKKINKLVNKSEKLAGVMLTLISRYA